MSIAGIPEWTMLVMGTLTGAAIGAFAPYYLRIRRQKRTIRTALYTEIESMQFPIERWSDIVFESNPKFSKAPILGTSPFTDTVYTSNAGEIGLLSEEEAKAVEEFYSLVSWYDDVLYRFHDDGELPGSVTMVLLRRLPLLRVRMNLALQKIEENSSDLDVKDRQFVEFDSPEDIENAVRRYTLNKYETITFSQDWDLVKEQG